MAVYKKTSEGFIPSRPQEWLRDSLRKNAKERQDILVEYRRMVKHRDDFRRASNSSEQESL